MNFYLGTLGGTRLERLVVLVVSVLLETSGAGGSKRTGNEGADGAGCFLGTLLPGGDLRENEN